MTFRINITYGQRDKLCRESHILCRLKNPTVISIWLLVGFHPATRSVQCTPADNARKRAPGGIYRKKECLLNDWRESCLLIGPISLHKSLYLSGKRPKPVHKLILHKNQLELVSRS